jgi:hypothetical protein
MGDRVMTYGDWYKTMNLVWFKDLKFAPTQAALIEFNVANFKSTTLVQTSTRKFGSWVLLKMSSLHRYWQFRGNVDYSVPDDSFITPGVPFA